MTIPLSALPFFALAALLAVLLFGLLLYALGFCSGRQHAHRAWMSAIESDRRRVIDHLRQIHPKHSPLRSKHEHI